jgi:hypothetical protein
MALLSHRHPGKGEARVEKGRAAVGPTGLVLMKKAEPSNHIKLAAGSKDDFKPVLAGGFHP